MKKKIVIVISLVASILTLGLMRKKRITAKLEVSDAESEQDCE